MPKMQKSLVFNLPLISFLHERHFQNPTPGFRVPPDHHHYYDNDFQNVVFLYFPFLEISEVDIDLLTTCDGSSTLETLNLEENPLSRDCQDNLGTINSIRILITPREMEEWEDLSI